MILLVRDLAMGQQYKVLYTFGTNPADALNVTGPLAFDRAGNLYGTSQVGGITPNCNGGGCGTVYEMSPNNDGTWSENVIYDFCANYGICADGAFPATGVVVDSAGNLYGVAPYGGNSTYQCYTFVSYTLGCGVAFELSPPSHPGDAWTYTALYSFCMDFTNSTCQDGGVPLGLSLGANGNLYGTTERGGSTDEGTVFELSPGEGGWTETVIHNFCPDGWPNCSDGGDPEFGVSLDQLGNLYGTTDIGGDGGGTVYKLTPNNGGWTETVLYTLPKRNSGFNYFGEVSLDSNRNVYIPLLRGIHSNGLIARLSPSGVLKMFSFNGSDGKDPILGAVAIDSQRHAVYGATNGGQFGTGNIFKIDPLGNETVLHAFCEQMGCMDGYFPAGEPIEDRAGNLYGTTELGGTNQKGVVYEITP